MQFIWIMSFMSILTAVVITGCREQVKTAEDAQINIDLTVEPAELAVGNATLSVVLTDTEGNPIEDATIEVRGNMTHAGMAPVLASATDGEAGLYQIPFEWTMSGDWLVDVTVTLVDGEVVQERFEYTIATSTELYEGDVNDVTPESESNE
ncbi:MAG: hypothetical protein CL610_15720 [Anaerolineaceae bacterium]|nr:hypothetical protein [Anaerolineaceae bacterium]